MEKQKIILFGCGKVLSQFLKVLDKKKNEIIGLCDNNEKLWGTEIKGYPVYPVDKIVELPFSKIIITVANGAGIVEELANMGITGEWVMDFSPVYRKSAGDKEIHAFDCFVKKFAYKRLLLKIKLSKIVKESKFIFDSPFSILIAALTNPFFFLRRNLFINITYFSQRIDGKLLDFGCGSKPYKRYFDKCSEYVGCDIEVSGHGHVNEDIDIFYDGKTLPFEDATFDNIFSSEVFEHIFNLEPIIQELNRVLKPGGGMLVTVPFVWNEHEGPYDFGRYTSFGLTDLLARNGFEIVEFKKSTHYVEVLFQMWIEYLRYSFSKIPSPFVQGFLHTLFIIPAVLMGCLISAILPKNYSFYGNNVVYARKKRSRKMLGQLPDGELVRNAEKGKDLST